MRGTRATVHYECLTVVETHKEGGQLIVMNRNGDITILVPAAAAVSDRTPCIYGRL